MRDLRGLLGAGLPDLCSIVLALCLLPTGLTAAAAAAANAHLEPWEVTDETEKAQENMPDRMKRSIEDIRCGVWARVIEKGEPCNRELVDLASSKDRSARLQVTEWAYSC